MIQEQFVERRTTGFKSIREKRIENLLREALPYLQSVENGTTTSPVLRGLIEDSKRELGK
jgi:hypothetical protein